MINRFISHDQMKTFQVPRDLRYEQKFETKYFHFRELELAVQIHPSLFLKHFPDRIVNNIYFDDSTYSSFNENLEGINYRTKLRMRWYGNTQQVKIYPKIEFKRKFGHVGDKVKLSMPAWNNKKGINMSDIYELIKSSSQGNELYHILYNKEPKILNSYLRKYYITADKKIRLTIDRKLSYVPFKNGHAILDKQVNPDEVIVEVKYSKLDQDIANKAFEGLGIRKTKYSKYCAGITALANNLLITNNFIK